MNQATLSALIGLTGAIENHGNTPQTDALVREAILSAPEDDFVPALHREKKRIAPGCASCPTPCGNTSDYPPECFALWPAAQRALKEQLLQELHRIAAASPPGELLPEVIYRGITYLKYDLADASYLRLLEEMKQW